MKFLITSFLSFFNCSLFFILTSKELISESDFLFGLIELKLLDSIHFLRELVEFSIVFILLVNNFSFLKNTFISLVNLLSLSVKIPIFFSIF